MKKALFIYNPNAGKGLLKPKLSDIIDIIVKAGYEVVVYPTQKYKDAYYKVKTFTEAMKLMDDIDKFLEEYNKSEEALENGN